MPNFKEGVVPFVQGENVLSQRRNIFVSKDKKWAWDRLKNPLESTARKGRPVVMAVVDPL